MTRQLCGLWSPFFGLIDLRGLETSGINYLVTQRHIQKKGELNYIAVNV